MKAILVIDIPNDFCDAYSIYKIYEKEAPYRILDGIGDLKMLPEKKRPFGSDFFNDYVNGFNDCIDEIVKNEKDQGETK